MIKIGILGAGHLGKIHLTQLKELSDFQIVGFFDVNGAVSEKVSSDMGIPFFTDENKLIEACDAIDIVTPTITHYEYAVNAMRKFKHVFIEKPIAVNINEARILVDLAKEAGVKVQIGHVERFNPAFSAARPYIQNPMFIETHRLAQFNPRGTDVSVILDLMIHDIDIVLNVVKSNIKKINASGVSVISDTPDIANARIEFDNGCVANLTASRISLKNMRKSRFFQKDAYISVDFLEKEVSMVKIKNKQNEDDPFAMELDLGPGKDKKLIYFENPEVQPVNAIRKELELFGRAIKEDSIPFVTVEDGWLALDVAHKIIEKFKLTSA